MERTTTRPSIERTDEERKATAEEIHRSISLALERLLEQPDVSDEHSIVVELRSEQLIARRALDYFDAEEPLARAA